TCPSTGVNTVTINLTDANDTADATATTGANFTINGGNGNDNLTGSPGDDTLNGGGGDAGTDRAIYSGSLTALDITIDNAANDTDGTGATTENVTDTVESITGGNGDDQ